ncbi:MAG: 4Fe-4S binding protein [Elusimicrobia bacterium]|nr:4Fe-4S binding protein [Elusimicrobiota bacterium]
MLVYDPEKCIACGMCERACPSKCISFAVQKDAEGKSLRKIDWYLIDYGRCNFCGLCEEACPTKPKAVWHSLDYEAVFHSRDEMVRYWKSGDHFYGNIYNFELKAFEPVRGQLHLEGVPEHRRV